MFLSILLFLFLLLVLLLLFVLLLLLLLLLEVNVSEQRLHLIKSIQEILKLYIVNSFRKCDNFVGTVFIGKFT